MKRKNLVLAGAALGLAAVTAQAQTSDDLQRALAQAQAAAAAAQDAARKAQAALEQALAAAADAKRSSTTVAVPVGGSSVTAQVVPGSGLVVRSGDSYAQLYGLIDITYFSKNHADGTGHSVISPDVAWFSGNRWGLQGAHATHGPDGMKVIFKLESEFESQTGNMDTPGV